MRGAAAWLLAEAAAPAAGERGARVAWLAAAERAAHAAAARGRRAGVARADAAASASRALAVELAALGRDSARSPPQHAAAARACERALSYAPADAAALELLRALVAALAAPRAAAASARAAREHGARAAWALAAPRAGAAYAGEVPVRFDVRALEPARGDAAARVCAWLGGGATIAGCVDGAISLSDLAPGWHVLTAQAYGVPSQRALGAPRVARFCVRGGDVDDGGGCGSAPDGPDDDAADDAASDDAASDDAAAARPPRMVFFTLVLNGMPFLAHHARELERLTPLLRARRAGERDGPDAPPPLWEWHLVEGVAAGRADARAPYSRAALLPDADAMRNGTGGPDAAAAATAAPSVAGLSTDGTSEFIDDLAAARGDRVFVHRRCATARGAAPGACAWRDKTQMANRVAHALGGRGGGRGELLLVQLDADELWRAEQWAAAFDAFDGDDADGADAGAARPWRCAYFHCHFLIGDDLATATPGGWGHGDAYEWLRRRRVERGARLRGLAHAPPMLASAARARGRVDRA